MRRGIRNLEFFGLRFLFWMHNSLLKNAARTHIVVVVVVSDIQLMSRLVREYVPLEQGRRRLAATAVLPPLIAAPEDGFLVFANSAGHRLLVFALLINFDENKLGEKRKLDGVFRIRYYSSGSGSASVPISEYLVTPSLGTVSSPSWSA
jgi:hypothetical protein